MLAGSFAEGLRLLGSVDLGQAHADRPLKPADGRVAAHGQRVAVGDADDQAGEDRSGQR
jgi:hypothetical protein